MMARKFKVWMNITVSILLAWPVFISPVLGADKQCIPIDVEQVKSLTSYVLGQKSADDFEAIIDPYKGKFPDYSLVTYLTYVKFREDTAFVNKIEETKLAVELDKVINYQLYKAIFSQDTNKSKLFLDYLSSGYFRCIAPTDSPILSVIELQRSHYDTSDPLVKAEVFEKLRYSSLFTPTWLERYLKKLVDAPEYLYLIEKEYWHRKFNLCASEPNASKCGEEIKAFAETNYKKEEERMLDTVFCSVGVIKDNAIYTGNICR